MASSADPAIIRALGLDPEATHISSYGGSSFSSTFKLTTTVEGKEKNIFVKTGTGNDAKVMFKGEHTSLNAIHASIPSLCPASHAYGPLTSPGRFFLATDFLTLSGHGPKGSGQTLAHKLAKLHTTPAPTPEGHDRPQFGFPVPTCCGNTIQDNSFCPSWSDFYANNRLRSILQTATRVNGSDAQLADAVEIVASKVVPRLLGDGHLKGVAPVVVHGDLWSGNHDLGIIAGEGGVEEVVFDPSCVYGHSEYELGIMRMFGGFGSEFWAEYESLVPKSEPVEEWDDRIQLYELYHHLNHYALFGASYKGGAMSITSRLIKKYGN